MKSMLNDNDLEIQDLKSKLKIPNIESAPTKELLEAQD